MTQEKPHLGVQISPAATEALATFLSQMTALRGAAKNTTEAYQADILGFLAFITQHTAAPQGLNALKAITVQDMRAWMAFERGRGVGARSLARSLSAVKSFYAWLAEREGFEPTAVLSTRAPKFQNKLPRPLTKDAAVKVLDNLEDVVEQIEGFEGKSSVCMTEVTAVMAKFMELGQQSSELTKQGKKPSEAQIERQMKLAARAQKMQSALANTQPDMSC